MSLNPASRQPDSEKADNFPIVVKEGYQDNNNERSSKYAFSFNNLFSFANDGMIKKFLLINDSVETELNDDTLSMIFFNGAINSIRIKVIPNILMVSNANEKILTERYTPSDPKSNTFHIVIDLNYEHLAYKLK